MRNRDQQPGQNTLYLKFGASMQMSRYFSKKYGIMIYRLIVYIHYNIKFSTLQVVFSHFRKIFINFFNFFEKTSKNHGQRFIFTLPVNCFCRICSILPCSTRKISPTYPKYTGHLRQTAQAALLRDRSP